jgi:hypothetical protein
MLIQRCAVRDKRHAGEWQSRLTFIARDEREIVGESGRSDPEVIRRSSSAGRAQLAVASGDRAIDIDDGSLCEVQSFDGWFGDAVALDGEGNVALVGAPWAAEDRGAAYAFAGEGTSWSQQAEFTLANARRPTTTLAERSRSTAKEASR